MATNSGKMRIYFSLALVLIIAAIAHCEPTPPAPADQDQAQPSSAELPGLFGPPYADVDQGNGPDRPDSEVAVGNGAETNTKSPTPESQPEGASDEPATKAPSPSEVANFTVRDSEGKACIRACFSAVFNVFYHAMKDNQKQEVETKVPLPAKAKATGTCGSIQEPAVLSIQWNEGKFNMKFTFGNLSDDGKDYWQAKRLQFTYDTSDDQYFSDAIEAGPRTVRSDDDAELFKTPVENSRICEEEEAIKLLGRNSNNTAKVMLEMRDLQLQPCNLQDDSFSEGVPCKEDKGAEGTNIASIAVGATLACVILLVIIGYAVGRRMGAITDRTSYSSME